MTSRGFTLIELLISVSIFVFMTALIVTKYGNFNQSVLLTNLAYDVALTVRTAQTYGLSVKANAGLFNTAYGVSFIDAVTGATCTTSNVTSSKAQFIMFADTNSNGGCDATDSLVSTYNIKRGAVISDVCVGSDAATCSQNAAVVKRVDITFKRPDPAAVIYGGSVSTLTTTQAYPYAQITVQGTDGSTRKVVIRSNGQISVGE